MTAHLFVDISSHGFGHLGTTAPVLAALRAYLPKLRLTIRTGLPHQLLRARLGSAFTYIEKVSNVGFVQKDAMHIDHEATRAAYRRAHDNFPQRIAAEAAFLAGLKPDLVLSNVSCLPLAGAAASGIPALALCSLNWLDMLRHFYAREEWAQPVITDTRMAYEAAELFLALTPGMPMADLPRRRVIGPVATVAAPEARQQTRRSLGVADGETLALVAMGGFDCAIPVGNWPSRERLRYLVPASWEVSHPAAISYGMHEYSFGSLLRAADAVLTKPGYGTFVEAACTGVPVLYVRREDWPEQDYLIRWLETCGVCGDVGRADLASGAWLGVLDRVLQMPRPMPVEPSGTRDAVAVLAPYLEH